MSELTSIVDKGLLDYHYYDFITIMGDLNNNMLVTKSDGSLSLDWMYELTSYVKHY